jgi:hypothetical protein
MKKTTLLVQLLTATLFFLSSNASLMAGPVSGQVKSVSGHASLITASGNSKPITVGMAIPEGSKIHTGSSPDSKVIIEWVPGDTSIITADTTVTVSSLDYGTSTGAPVRTVSLNLTKGNIFSHLVHNDGGATDFRIRTPEGVAAARGTDFNVHFAHGILTVTGFSDEVTITLVNGRAIRVRAGFSYHSGDADSGPSSPDDINFVIDLLRSAGFTVTGSIKIGFTISGDGITFTISPWAFGGPPNGFNGGQNRYGPPGETPFNPNAPPPSH